MIGKTAALVMLVLFPIGSLACEYASSHDTAQTLVQRVLDLTELQPYYHFEIAARTPVRLLKNEHIPESLLLSKNDQAVLIQPFETLSSQADSSYFIFDAIDIENNIAVIEFRYPVEGISGVVRFSKKNDLWTVVQSKIVEH